MNIDLSDVFNNIKKSKWSKPIYISLTVAINTLLAFSGVCFAYVLMGLLIFSFPYLFGERRAKTIIKVGLIIILLTGVVFGLTHVYLMYNHLYPYHSDYVKDNKSTLTNGTISPYIGEEHTLYNYSVMYRGNESYENITLYVNIIGGFPESNFTLDYHIDELYYNNTIGLEEAISPYYLYRFAIEERTLEGVKWSVTSVGIGPINKPLTSTLILFISSSIVGMFMQIGLLFFLIILLYWWTKKAKIERLKWREEPTEEMKEEGKEGEETKEEVEEEQGKQDVRYTCTECGADVRADAGQCPKCGAKFEGFEED